MIRSFLIFLHVILVAGDIHDNIFLSHLFQSNETQNLSDRLDNPSCEQGGTYSLPHRKYCDRFYTCINGEAILEECLDGLGYATFIGCKPLHLVDCVNRPYLQTPKGNAKCPRLYGIFNDPRGCGRYFRCENGRAVEGRCPQRYMYDDRGKQCQKPTPHDASKCSSHFQNYQPQQSANLNDFVAGFTCPDISSAVLPFGQHSRHPYPANCRYFIVCLKDGTVKLSGCEKGMAFSPATGVCEPENLVQSCRNRSF